MAELSISVNELDLASARLELARAFGALDAKRPTAWNTYGYPETVCFADMLSAYERGGAAHGAVHRLLDGCWQETPRIKRPGDDEESDWEKGVDKVLKSVQAWAKLRDMDRRNMVGRYAAVIYRVGDSKSLREPLQTARRLVDLVPVYEDQIKVTAWNSDQDSEDFGKPTMWQYRSRRPSPEDTQGQPDQWVDVHPSRIQILAEGSVGDDFFGGVPLLKAGYNTLIDIEKISGGSAESYLKNSARTLVFKYEKEAALQALTHSETGETISVRQAHEQQTRALNRNQDSSIVIQGGDASTLQTATHDPTGAFQLAANLFAASVRIPFTILFGQQTGRLASDEDKADFHARCASRRESELTPMIEQFVRRMQAAGLIEAGEFEVEWPQLGEPTDTERLDNLGKMTAAMQQAFQAGLTEPLFDANELRKSVGYEERSDDGMPTPEDLKAAADAQMATQVGAKQAAQQKPAPAKP